jgi:hypothetical protein
MADNTPQFGTAEYSNVPGTERCAVCKQLIGTSYYRINSQMACASCADRAKSGMPVDSHSSYMKALTFGAGAAFVGFLLYSGVGMATGWVIGYMSLAVGWLVGSAMKKGAQGAGGRKYQITAALLTYAAVSMSAIPISLYMQNAHAEKSIQQSDNRGSASGDDSTKSPDTSTSDPSAKEKPGLASSLGTLLLIGLASPFLELGNGVSGVIGLVILWVGIQFAWKATAAHPLAVDGPYENGPVKSAGAAGA